MAMTRLLVFISLLTSVCSLPLAAEEPEYFAVLMQGKKVGYAIHTRQVEGDKVTTREDVSITITRVGFPVTITMTEISVETIAGKPLSFESIQLLASVSMKVRGVVSETGQIELTTSSFGAEKKSTRQWPQGAVMSEGLRLMTLDKGLQPGTEYTARIFSPGIMDAVEAKVRIGDKTDVDLLGRVVKLTETTTEMTMPGSGRTSSTSYVDDDLEVQKSTMSIAGIQVDMIACAKEFALGDNDVLELVTTMFIQSPVSMDVPNPASSITYWLKPKPEADLVIPTMDNQRAERLSDGTIKLVIQPVAMPEGATFPYKGDDAALLEAVEPTRFLQSGDEEVIRLAQKAVGSTQDAGEAARRIESFVAEYMENKDLSVGYASAAEVAASRQGDCSEFAVLTAAMCRAVGIPAQVVVGVAYVKDFAGHEGFGGHAWNRAYIGGRWVGLDAAFKSSGRGGYDAGHIAFAYGNGEPSAFFNMAGALGQFTIEKMTVEKPQ